MELRSKHFGNYHYNIQTLGHWQANRLELSDELDVDLQGNLNVIYRYCTQTVGNLK
jgi:hypothetical protein